MRWTAASYACCWPWRAVASARRGAKNSSFGFPRSPPVNARHRGEPPGLQLEQLLVLPARREERLVRPLLDDRAGLHGHDPVRLANRGESMGDDDGRQTLRKIDEVVK